MNSNAAENWNNLSVQTATPQDLARIEHRMMSRRGALGVMVGAMAALNLTLNAEADKKHADKKKEVEARFAQENSLIRKIKEKGSFGKYFNDLDENARREQFHATRQKKPDVISETCIDEGKHTVLDEQGNETFVLHIAGSGIFPAIEGFDTETYNPMGPAYIAAVAKVFAAKGITLVTSHVECGAAAAAYQKVHKLSKEQMEEVPPQKIDAFAKEWSKSLARTLKQEYITMNKKELADKVRYQEETSLDRPNGVHVARYGILDATGKGYRGADHTVVPSSFIASDVNGVRKALMDTDVSWKITRGRHGPNDLITPENPYHLVGMAQKDQAIAMRRLLDEWHGKQSMEDWRRTRVEAFTPDIA